MIQVINRALDILEYSAKHPDHVYSLTDIADHFGLNHATCANILKTLVIRKYIEQVGHKKGYRLGSMAYYLTGNITFRNNLVDIAKPVMKDLCELLNESVIMVQYSNLDSVEKEEQTTSQKTGKTCEAASEGNSNNLIVCVRRRTLN